MHIAILGRRAKSLCALLNCAKIRAYTEASHLPNLRWELLALTRDGAQQLALCRKEIRCSTLLLPGDFADGAALVRALAPAQCIDYGFSLRDSLTLSSVGSTHRQLCLQRQIVRCDGETVEPQEILLTNVLPACPDEHILLLAGVLLLLGIEPQSVLCG